MIEIYTDGSSRGNPGPGGWGAVIIYDNQLTIDNSQPTTKNQGWVREIGGREDHTTNNRMELTAAIEALRSLTTNYLLLTTIHIYTDSKYVMQGITTWIHNWVKKGWRTANKKPVLNQDLWQELLSATEGKEIDWHYVEGHAGVELNERADIIATSFADGVDIDLYNGPRESYKFIQE